MAYTWLYFWMKFHLLSADKLSNKSLVNDSNKPVEKAISIFDELMESSYWCEALLLIVFASLYEEQLKHWYNSLNENKRVAFIASFSYKLLKAIVGVVVLCIILIVVVPLFIILFVAKRIIILLIYFRFGNSVSELFGMDMLFATSFEAKNPIINVFLKFDGNLSFENLKNLVQNKIDESEIPGGSNAFKKFKQTLQSYCGYFVWKDIDNFDINNHIKKINLSELYPGEAQNIYKTNSLPQNSCAEILTCKYLSEYGSRPFPENLPQWEVLILTEEGSSDDIMLLRLHHSIGDGLSLLRLLLEELADEKTTISFSQPSMTTFEKILLHIWCVALLPYVILLMFQGRKNPLHGADLNEKKIYVTSKDIPFDIVKSIKKGTKASATDILFSCLSFSLASFFQTRAVEVSDITMFFPIGEYDPNTPVTLSNTFTMGIATLPTPSLKSLKESCSENFLKFPYLERLQAVKREFDVVKGEPIILSIKWAAFLMALVIPSFLSQIIFRPSGKTISVSNVPGPLTDVYMVGKRIKEIRFWVPDNSPNGAGFTFISYKGQLRVSFNVDTALISKQEEAEKLIEDFIFALESLQKEVNEKNY